MLLQHFAQRNLMRDVVVLQMALIKRSVGRWPNTSCNANSLKLMLVFERVLRVNADIPATPDTVHSIVVLPCGALHKDRDQLL